MRGTVRWAVSASLLALYGALPIAAHATVDHTAWGLLLKRHVVDGLVDYEGVRQDRATLDRYLASLQDVQPSQLGSREARLAFWINAYNANVVKGVLDHYLPAPSKARQAGPITSVKEVKGFFNRIRYRVGGRELTLNEIEGEGRALDDWRIHFAVVCASSSCPLLRSEAYVPERLEAQLVDQTTRFLADASRGLRVEGRVLWVSKIFQWYAKDFVPDGPLTAASLWAVIGLYVSVEEALFRNAHLLMLKFLDYDWSLNVQRR